jgi:hypothetical protein
MTSLPFNPLVMTAAACLSPIIHSAIAKVMRREAPTYSLILQNQVDRIVKDADRNICLNLIEHTSRECPNMMPSDSEKMTRFLESWACGDQKRLVPTVSFMELQ